MSELRNTMPSPPPSAPGVRRAGKNHDGYHGETIDINAVLDECLRAARAHGWTIETTRVAPDLNLQFLTRPGGAGQGGHSGDGARSPVGSEQGLQPGRRRPRIYLSTGIHGDEPAGPLAARRLIEENAWPAALDLWLCPCLNPTGFLLNRRENAGGIDLNRQYLRPQAPETLAHIAWLERQPAFDLCLCLHEDWESHGFYLYELNPDRRASLAEPMVASAEPVCPIDRSEVIEDRPARNGVIRPDIDPRTRPQWPEAFYLLMNKTRLSYTLEAPSDFPLAARVGALVAAVQTALRLAANQAT